MDIRRGGCYLAALDPAMGHEISKTRPVIVVSNNKNIFNEPCPYATVLDNKVTVRTVNFSRFFIKFPRKILSMILLTATQSW
jgi:mRNA-degrading endonuclease toxin of MazEF toxin-antitoxin module